MYTVIGHQINIKASHHLYYKGKKEGVPVCSQSKQLLPPFNDCVNVHRISHSAPDVIAQLLVLWKGEIDIAALDVHRLVGGIELIICSEGHQVLWVFGITTAEFVDFSIANDAGVVGPMLVKSGCTGPTRGAVTGCTIRVNRKGCRFSVMNHVRVNIHIVLHHVGVTQIAFVPSVNHVVECVIVIAGAVIMINWPSGVIVVDEEVTSNVGLGRGQRRNTISDSGQVGLSVP